MQFLNDFERASYIERLFFRELITRHKVFDLTTVTVNATDYTGNDSYDFWITEIAYPHRRFIVEIKVRESNFDDGYFYEKMKHKKLMEVKALDPDKITIIYCNSTPTGSYIWNIDKIIHKYKTASRSMKKSTVDKGKEINKSVYTLTADDAKYYSYHWTSQQFTEHIVEKKRIADSLLPKKKIIGFKFD